MCSVVQKILFFSRYRLIMTIIYKLFHLFKCTVTEQFLSLHTEMLEQTFKALHFKVILHRWLSAADILLALTETMKMKEMREVDCFVCCIISRSTENQLLGTDLNGPGLDLDGVKQFFTAHSCPALVGKPKLFFIQRYSIPGYQNFAWREHRDEDLETDGYTERPRCNVIPEDADIFWSHCLIDERQLERGQHNSVFLKALTEALQRSRWRFGKTLNSKSNYG